MKLSSIFIICGLWTIGACLSSEQSFNTIPKEVQTFLISKVKLLEGPFKRATELNRKSLLQYDLDRLLAKFRIAAGLEPKAKHYGGWEDDTIAGHSLGHHLSACALMYQTTGEEQFLERVKYIVKELAECQNADGDGYLGAIPDGKRIYEEEISKGAVRPQSFSLNGLWAPFYTQHKVMAGLRDAYRLCGIEQGLQVSKKFADWLDEVLKPLSKDQIQHMLACEHGGMNEVLVDLYVDTRDEKYLDMSRIFHHEAVLDSLAVGLDILPGIHGNTQIPKLIGLTKRYQVTKEEQDLAVASFFWETVVNHHSYVTGGHGNHEYFGQPDQLRNRLSNGTTETCNVYNMLKLSSLLFKLHPSAAVADYYERALFNQILASQHPQSGKVIYNLSLEMGGHKVYQDPEWFTCCVGTGMENHSKYGKNIFYYNDEEVYVSQFISAEADWTEKNLKIRQVTNYPDEQNTHLELETGQPQTLKINIRYPYWAEKGMEVNVNAKPVEIHTKPGNFFSIERKWKSGDKIDISFPFSLRLETMPDDSNRVAIMYGPLVMAGDLGPEDDPNAYAPDYVPVLLTESRDPNLWLQPGNKTNEFIVTEVGHPRNFSLIPFYRMHDRRYSVYWDIYNAERWAQRQAENQAEAERRKQLDEATHDIVQPGDENSEKSHNLQSEKSEIISHQNRNARHANRGGWFSYTLKTMKGVSMTLAVEYWGGFTGSKTFDILIDGQKIATENISSVKDGYFIINEYKIPEALTISASKVNVLFNPHEGHRAGPVFTLRTIRR